MLIFDNLLKWFLLCWCNVNGINVVMVGSIVKLNCFVIL